MFQLSDMNETYEEITIFGPYDIMKGESYEKQHMIVLWSYKSVNISNMNIEFQF